MTTMIWSDSYWSRKGNGHEKNNGSSHNDRTDHVYGDRKFCTVSCDGTAAGHRIHGKYVRRGNIGEIKISP